LTFWFDLKSVSSSRIGVLSKPKTQAAIELKKLTLQLTKQTKEEFVNNLNLWYLRWADYLNERSKSPKTGKTFYTHKRLRSAYLSLKRHLPYLFVFEEYRELMIPNTTNALEGQFANLKTKLRNHNGLSKAHKIKFIDGFLRHKLPNYRKRTAVL